MTRRLASILAFVLCAAFLAFPRLAPPAAHAQGAGAAPAQKIGLVNVRRLFMGYARTRARENEIQVRYKKIEDELKGQHAALEARKAGLVHWKKDDPIYRQKLQALAEEYELVNGRMEWAKQHLAVDMRRATEEIFTEILAEVETYGKRHGYSLILKIDDQEIASTSDAELKLKLAQKQVLYYDPALDLTPAVRKQLEEKHR